MGLGALIPVLIWLGYGVLITLFVRPIAKHALAIYCTRVKDRDDEHYRDDADPGELAHAHNSAGTKWRDGVVKHRVRVFLRNLESEPLDAGPYTLRIELHPHDGITDPLVRAGAKCFVVNNDKLELGVWEVYFQDLPPHDTWLFEMDAPTDRCKATITLAPSTGEAKERINDYLNNTKKKPSWPDKSTWAATHRLATKSLVLSHDRAWDIAGSYVTPRWSAVMLLIALSVAAYILAILMVLPAPGTCAVAQPGLTDCLWERFREHIETADLWVAVMLVVATIISTSTGLRRPFPIAQGYLEKSQVVELPRQAEGKQKLPGSDPKNPASETATKAGDGANPPAADWTKEGHQEASEEALNLALEAMKP